MLLFTKELAIRNANRGDSRKSTHRKKKLFSQRAIRANRLKPVVRIFCLGTKNQPEAFQTRVFSWTSARDVRAKMLVFFQDLEHLTEVFGGMSAGISGTKLPLWADFFIPD